MLKLDGDGAIMIAEQLTVLIPDALLDVTS